jgi:uncharacterized protein (DUF58 family)
MAFPVVAPRWEPTFAHHRAALLGLGLVTIALLSGRADLLVLGAPLALVAVWSAAARPHGDPAAHPGHTFLTVFEGESATWRVEVDHVPGMRSVVASHPTDRWLELEPESGVVLREVDGSGGSTQIELGLRSDRWGRRTLGQPEVAAYGVWNAWRWGPVYLPRLQVTTLPVLEPFDSRAPAPHPHGLVGINRAARIGEGMEFAKVRPFQVGDRLRRIHWPVSARTGQLHVTATYSDDDSMVLLLVDALNDIGDSAGLPGQPSSMDVTVRAAAAIAEHHLRRGDRVGLRVFGSWHVTRVPAASGRSHLRRILDSLALIEPGTMRGDDGNAARRSLPPETLVIMLSPLVDPAALDEAVTLARHGHIVVVIDTLPPGVHAHVSDHDDEIRGRIELAWRMRTLERRLELERVVSMGIPVVPWAGRGSLDQVLLDLSRHASAPRMVRR